MYGSHDEWGVDSRKGRLSILVPGAIDQANQGKLGILPGSKSHDHIQRDNPSFFQYGFINYQPILGEIN